jgi:hypothetical protein
MKTFNFKPRTCHTYDARVRNPFISHTYEKHRGEGVALCWGGTDRAHP